ncbi:polysaccharide deacetylase family protein [Dactylosporangium sp. CA-152071]|uniref:polysaccharide deacetylase family protein n=1 Tax=Dactylosporangium sp. CA-152071 TaxID=3239933 RepID=UPI003D90D53E
MRRGLAWAAGVAGAAWAVHAAPAVTACTPLRRAVLPGLAGAGAAGHVALTFDDGPDRRSTPQFLRVLAEHDVRATFFLLASMLQHDPDLGREIVAAGHEVAVHGWAHRCLLWRTPGATADDITAARDLIAATTGVSARYYRPPYGVLTASALRTCRRIGLRPVLWTSWGRDWRARATPTSIVDTVAGRLAGGGTVLLHDSDCTSAPGSWQRTLAALPRIITLARDRGLTVGTLGEHLGEQAGEHAGERAGERLAERRVVSA